MVNGWGRAAVDNMTGLNTRADYNPTDPDDYNNALDATDVTMEVHGIGLMAVGTIEMAAGANTMAASPATGPATPITASGGAALVMDGVLNTTLGAIMYMNASGQGENNYGNDGGSGSGGSSSDSNSQTFNGKQDTNSESAREAFRKAKEQNGVPRSQQPSKQYTTPDKNTGEPLRTYDYQKANGEKVTIRKDKPVKYPDGGEQGPHYNAGTKGDKLRQHHNYKK